MRYNKLSDFFKANFGGRLEKICIDAGFTCPNRDGKKGYGGCIFCSEKGSGDHIDSTKSIRKQVEDFLVSYKADRAEKYIAYFQNFTNTYDSVENLKKKYDAALIDDRIAALAIATRPDCITEEIAKLIASYKNKYYVWVELGLQTANNETGKLLNRGYTTEEFVEAVTILRKYNIDVVTHMMVGLPGETFEDTKATLDFINKQNIQGIKIHSVYVIKNTVLGKMYEEGKYTPITFDYYFDTLLYIVTHLRKDIVIHRINADAPKELFLAPEWNLHKKVLMNKFTNTFEREDLYQGMYYEEK